MPHPTSALTALCRLALIPLALCATASPTLARTVVPISQTQLSDGTIRFSIPVTIGDTTVQAQLDTGSTGLKFLAAAVPADQYTVDGQQLTSLFGSGVEYQGPTVGATVTIGNLQSENPMPAELIDKVGCGPADPTCPASKIPPSSYGIGGDGKAGQGFVAIIGVGLRKQPGLVNPLTRLSRTGRWIIELPDPGTPGTGALIIDPWPGELEGYSLMSLTGSVQTGWADNAVQACLTDEREQVQICGNGLIDSGNSTIDVQEPAPVQDVDAFPTGSLAMLVLNNAQGIQFRVDGRAGATVTVEPNQHGAGTLMNLGYLPFISYRVAYDWRNGTIGLRRRP